MFGSKFLIVVFLFFVVKKIDCFILKNLHQEDTLVAVITLFRHGDRSPTKSFPNDAYFKEQYWPMGYGQLTNSGKARMYELGKWFRKRYNSFISQQYSPENVYVRSTNPARCLMSAYAVLAGLFPPKRPQMFNKNLPWQPIPVHTMPIEIDEVLSMTKQCPKYINLLQETLTSQYVQKITSKFGEFLNTVSKYSGWNNTDIRQAATLETNLDIYTNYNSSFIPTWTKLLDKKILERLAGVNHQRYTLTQEQKRLLTGPFWTNFFSHFDNAMNNVTGTPKMLMLSAHDTTIASLLNCMQVYDIKPPGFGATLIWELKRSYNGSYYINLFYKKTDHEANLLPFQKCGVNCDYKNFKEMLTSLTLSGKDWEEECKDVMPVNSTRKTDKKPFFT